MALPEHTDAIVFTAAGGLEVIDKATFPFPQQKPNEVLVKVRSDGSLV